MKRKEWIYETMMGEAEPACPCIADAFAPGERCAGLYEEIYQTNRKLCVRLGVEEDGDLERIISLFFEINRELCMRMYDYGVQDSIK